MDYLSYTFLMYQLTHNRINIRRITLEAIHGRPDLYRVSNINPEGQAAKKVMLQNGDILRTVNNIVMQGKVSMTLSILFKMVSYAIYNILHPVLSH